MIAFSRTSFARERVLTLRSAPARRYWLGIVLVLILPSCTAEVPEAQPEDPGRIALESAVQYLWSQQHADGAWRSETHAWLRSGQALTPFVLLALLESERVLARRDPEGARRALAFIRSSIGAQGIVGLAEPGVPEYPNYATAFALRCFLRIAPAGDEAIGRLVVALKREQFRAAIGFDESSPVFGAWGFGGRRPEGSPGHVDLSYTRHVLEALQEAGCEDPDLRARVRVFLARMQKRGEPFYDGGFFFTPNVPTANKAGAARAANGREYFRSYATATCDGVIALIAAGVTMNDERVEDALRWLTEHDDLEGPAGIPPDEPNGWKDSIRFYHWTVRAEAHRLLGGPPGWRDGIVRFLLAEQQADGSFVNTRNHLMKEDDPLLATALAVLALSHALLPST